MRTERERERQRERERDRDRDRAIFSATTHEFRYKKDRRTLKRNTIIYKTHDYDVELLPPYSPQLAESIAEPKRAKALQAHGSLKEAMEKWRAQGERRTSQGRVMTLNMAPANCPSSAQFDKWPCFVSSSLLGALGVNNRWAPARRPALSFGSAILRPPFCFFVFA